MTRPIRETDRNQVRIQRLIAPTLSAVVTTCLLGLGYAPLVAAASCVGPSIAVGRTADPRQPSSSVARLGRGQPTTVTGIFFHAGCEDSIGSGPGCQAVPQAADPQTPLTDVQLTLTQGRRTWDLGTADAADRDQQYAISWTATIPADVPVGAATLNAASASIPVQIR